VLTPHKRTVELLCMIPGVTPRPRMLPPRNPVFRTNSLPTPDVADTAAREQRHSPASFAELNQAELVGA